MPTASDDFAGSGALSGNWTTRYGSPVRTSGEFDSADAVDGSAADYTGASFGDDQFSQATLRTTLGGDYTKYVGIEVRISPDGGTLYQFYTDGADASVDSGHGGIAKYVAGADTFLAAVPGTWASGDVIKLEVIGTTIKLYRNGVEVASVTDSSITSGAPGLSSYPDAVRMDDWSGGDVSAGGISIPVVQAYRRMMGMR